MGCMFQEAGLSTIAVYISDKKDSFYVKEFDLFIPLVSSRNGDVTAVTLGSDCWGIARK